MKNLTCTLVMLIGITNTYTQNVFIPDANFKSHLLASSIYNPNMDTVITYAEANGIGSMDVSTLNISDLTGIEAFVNLTNLNCSSNNLTGINLSSNTDLTQLNCSLNNLTGINLSNNTKLTIIEASGNQLSALDVSNIPTLKQLSASTNLITSINLSNNDSLFTLHLNSNPITSLDVSNNPLVYSLGISYTAITALDLTADTALIWLFAKNNPQLTALDLSGLPNLNWVELQNNNLDSLNIKNGNNTAIFGFYVTNNPNLTCIKVDDVAWSTANWLDKDTTAIYSLNCGGVGISEIEKNKLDFSVFPNPATNSFTIALSPEVGSQPVTLIVVDVTGKTVFKTQLTQAGLTSVPTSNLPNGMYLLILKNNTKFTAKKLLISR